MIRWINLIQQIVMDQTFAENYMKLVFVRIIKKAINENLVTNFHQPSII